MTSDVASSAGGGDLSDFEYDSSLYYEPSGSETGGPGPGPSLGGGHNLPVDPFSNIASLGARMNVPDTIALLGDDEMHNYRLNDKLMVVNQACTFEKFINDLSIYQGLQFIFLSVQTGWQTSGLRVRW